MNLLKAAATISGLTMLSRITGLVRDMLIARYFGASGATDAYYVAIRLPNMLRRLFGEGAFQQAFVPMLSDVRSREGEGRAHEFIDRVASTLATVLLLVSVGGVLAAPLLVWVIASGLHGDPATFDLAVELTRWIFPYIFFMSLVAMCAAILNTWKHFAVPAFTPVLLNISLIVCTLLLTPRFERPIFALAVGVVAGGVLQLGIQIPALMKLGVLPHPASVAAALRDGAVRRTLKLMAPAILGVGVAHISILINTNIASHLAAGSVTWLSYADRLMEFPTALLGVALGTVLLPSLSAANARGDAAEYSGLLDWGLRLVVLLALPAATGLAVLSQALASVLFQGVQFTASDVVQTASAVVGYGVGLIGLIAVKILAPGFYARKDIATPVRVAIATLVCVQLMNLVFVPLFAHAGLALSVGLGACINSAILGFKLRRMGVWQATGQWKKLLAACLLGCLAMGGTLVAIQQGLGLEWTAMGWTVRACGTFALVGAGAAIYGAVILAFGYRPRDLRRMSA